MIPKLSFFLSLFWGFLIILGKLDAQEEKLPSLEEYQGQIQEILRQCEESQMTLEAEVTRSRLLENPEYGFFFPKLPSKKMDSLPEDATPRQKEWFERLTQIQEEFSERFWKAAEVKARNGEGEAAYRLGQTALFINPNHQKAREAFGYSLYQGEWRRSWEIKKMEKGERDDPRWGWVTEKERARYESQKKDRENQKNKGRESDSHGKSRPSSQSWRIETEHFEIKTTVSREAGVQLGRQLESFHFVWNLLFFRMNLSEKEAAGIILGKKVPSVPRHRVLFFRNRQEYLEEILQIDPTAGVSSGGYYSQVKTMFLYIPDPNQPDETSLDVMIPHEATHQLLAESRAVSSQQRRRGEIGEYANFWILESAATYMETFKIADNGYLLGGCQSYRFLRAKERLSEPGGLIPIQPLTAMGRSAFQKFPDLPMLYTESAGLASFFFHAEGGIYRDSFLTAILDVYRGEDDPETLSQRMKIDNSQIDVLFHRYLEKAPFHEN